MEIVRFRGAPRAAQGDYPPRTRPAERPVSQRQPRSGQLIDDLAVEDPFPHERKALRTNAAVQLACPCGRGTFLSFNFPAIFAAMSPFSASF